MKKILTVGEPLVMFIADSNSTIAEEKNFTKYVAGAEVNVSIGLKRLGYDVTFVTALGEDPFGECILNFLKNNDISTDFIELQKNRTGFLLKNREADGRDAQVVYFRDFTPATMLKRELIEAIDFSQYDLLHITGIFPLLSNNNFEFTLLMMDKAKELGIPVSFDPNCRVILWKGTIEDNIERMNKLISKADIFIPGISEIIMLSGKTELREAIEFYRDKVETIIIKDGAHCSYYIKGNEEITKSCFKVEVVDTVGAGDGFATGIVSGFLEGLEPIAMLERANAIGAIQVSNRSDNDGLPTREELENFIKTHS